MQSKQYTVFFQVERDEEKLKSKPHCLVGRLAVFFYSVMLFIYIIYIYSLNGRLKKRWQPDSCQPCDKISLDCMASLSMRGAQQKATDYDLNRVKLGKMLPCANTYHMHPHPYTVYIHCIWLQCLNRLSLKNGKRPYLL